MKANLGIIFLLAVSALCNAQTMPKNISPSQLQAIIDLPPSEAVKQREIYKVPLKFAYERQMAMSDRDLRGRSQPRSATIQLQHMHGKSRRTDG
jgi:hypothetical protein